MYDKSYHSKIVQLKQSEDSLLLEIAATFNWFETFDGGSRRKAVYNRDCVRHYPRPPTLVFVVRAAIKVFVKFNFHPKQQSVTYHGPSRGGNQILQKGDSHR